MERYTHLPLWWFYGLVMLVNKFFPVKYDKSLATCVQSRLNSDFIQIIKDPVEHVEVIRDPKNKQEWHFVVSYLISAFTIFVCFVFKSCFN